MDPPAKIENSSFFHNGVQFSVSARDFCQPKWTKLSCQRYLRQLRRHQHRQRCALPIVSQNLRLTNGVLPFLSHRPAVPPAPNAVPPRVVPVTRAPAVDSAPVVAPPLMLIPGLVPGALSEPLVPLADPEPVFGAITLGTDFVPEYLPLVLPSPVLAARFLARVSI